MNDFMATGGDGLALNSSAVRVEDLKTVDVDALAAYLRAQKQPVAASGEPRIIDVAAGAR